MDSLHETEILVSGQRGAAGAAKGMRGMGMKKIVVNAKVRALLRELDEIMDKFHVLSGTLARREISASEAMNAGYDRERIRGQIVGVAYRLNEASIRRPGMKKGRDAWE